MDRRSFLSALGLTAAEVGLTGVTSSSARLRPRGAGVAPRHAAQQPSTVSCHLGPLDRFGQSAASCQAGVGADALGRPVARRAATQHQVNMWCWAACLQGIFARHGYQVGQQQIVDAIWHQSSDPPQFGRGIVAAASRTWTDDAGRAFEVRARVLDVSPAAKMRALVAELARNPPVIINLQWHAALLTGVRYYRDRATGGVWMHTTDTQVEANEDAPAGVGWLEARWPAAFVWDPWPDTPGERSIDPEAWNRIKFAASLSVG